MAQIYTVKLDDYNSGALDRSFVLGHAKNLEVAKQLIMTDLAGMSGGTPLSFDDLVKANGAYYPGRNDRKVRISDSLLGNETPPSKGWVGEVSVMSYWDNDDEDDDDPYDGYVYEISVTNM